MSRHITDFTKTPLAIIFDLINHDNGTSLNQDKVDISAPVLGVGKEVSITVSSKLGSGFRGTQVLGYNRVPFTDLIALVDEDAVAVQDVTTLNEIVALFNAKYGVNVTDADITIDGVSIDGSTPYEQPQGPVQTLVIAAKDTSLVWHASTTFKLRSTVQLLSDVITVTNLDGLCLPGTWYLPPEQSVNKSSDGSIRTDDEGSVRIFAE